MRLIESRDHDDFPQELASYSLSFTLLVLSAASAIAILRIRRRCRRRLRDIVNPLWLVRLLLPLFASIWSLAELIGLPTLRRHLPLALQRRPDLLCSIHLVSSQALAEPAFLTVMLYLIRASIRPKPPSSATAFAAALGTALLSALPFVVLHSLYLSSPVWDLGRLGIPANFFGSNASGVHLVPSLVVESSRCSYPLFGTFLLAILTAVYVPVFVSASWSVVSLVINRRLRARLYVLCAMVWITLSVQVAALAFSTLWGPLDPEFQWLSLAAIAAVMTLAATGLAILVVRPIIDALSVSDVEAVPPDDASVVLVRHV